MVSGILPGIHFIFWITAMFFGENIEERHKLKFGALYE